MLWNFAILIHVCTKVYLTPPLICSCTQTGTSLFVQTTRPFCTPSMAPRFIFTSSIIVLLPQALTNSSFFSTASVSMANRQVLASSAHSTLFHIVFCSSSLYQFLHYLISSVYFPLYHYTFRLLFTIILVLINFLKFFSGILCLHLFLIFLILSFSRVHCAIT